jgi:hypothetical protein
MAAPGFISLGAGVKLDGFTKDLDTMRGKLRAMVPQVQSIGGNVGTAFIGGFAGGLAAQLTGVIGKAIGAVTGAVTSSIFSAGDFEGAIAKAELLFGKSSATIIASAEQMAESLGIVRSESIDAAVNLGNGFKSFGANADMSAALGVELMKLGTDLGRVAKQDPKEAFIALAAALRREFDPLERFGIAINAAMIENEGLRMGLAKTKGELTELDKRFAAMSLIRGQGAQFEGAAEKLRGTFNASLDEAKGRITRLKEEIGQGLTPVLAEFLAIANTGFKNLLPTMTANAGAFRAWVDDITAGKAMAVDSFGGIGSAIGYLIDVFGWLRGALKLGQAAFITFGAIGNRITERFFRAFEAMQKAVFGSSVDMASHFKTVADSMTQDALRFKNEGMDLFQPLGASAEAANKKIAEAFALLKKPVADAAKAVEKVALPIESMKKGGPIGGGGGGGLLATINAVTSAVDAAKQVADKVSMAPPKMAGAVEAGTAEARSSILQAQIGTPKDQQARALAMNTQQTAKNTNEANKLLAKLAMGGMGVFTF